MNKPTITIDIDEAGNTKISVAGVTGSACKTLTADIERALGTVTADVPTADMARQSVTASVQAKA